MAVDINRKRILSLEVTSEEVHDGRMLNKLINNASSFAAVGNHVKGVLADGITIATRISDMYQGTHYSWYKGKMQLQSQVNDCHARNMSVIRQKTNLKRWKCSTSYEYRWMAETFFS